MANKVFYVEYSELVSFTYGAMINAETEEEARALANESFFEYKHAELNCEYVDGSVTLLIEEKNE